MKTARISTSNQSKERRYTMLTSQEIDARLEAHKRLSDKIDCYLKEVDKLISIYESRAGIRREIDPFILMKMGRCSKSSTK